MPAADQAAALEQRCTKNVLRRYGSARAGDKCVKQQEKRYNNNRLEPNNGGECPTITYEAQDVRGSSLESVQTQDNKVVLSAHVLSSAHGPRSVAREPLPQSAVQIT